MKKTTIISFVIILLAIIAAFYIFHSPSPVKANLDDFAQCLASKSITMYGAYWCAHCQNQKAEFGSSFRLVPYVECTQDPNKCIGAGVTAYPTWIFPDGRKLVGEQKIQLLSDESGCLLENGK